MALNNQTWTKYNWGSEPTNTVRNQAQRCCLTLDGKGETMRIPAASWSQELWQPEKASTSRQASWNKEEWQTREASWSESAWQTNEEDWWSTEAGSFQIAFKSFQSSDDWCTDSWIHILQLGKLNQFCYMLKPLVYLALYIPRASSNSVLESVFQMISKTLKLSCHIKELDVGLFGPPAMEIIRRIAKNSTKHENPSVSEMWTQT